MPIFMLYDKNYNLKTTLNDFISMIWVSKFREIGEFELQVYDTLENRIRYRPNDIIRRTDQKQVMFVEKITTRRAVDEPDTLLISGRSCESILSRRVIANSLTFAGSDVYRIAKMILDDNVINPSSSDRKIEGFVMGTTADVGANATVTESYHEQVDEVLTDICEESGCGWRVDTSGSVPTGEYAFYIYKGIDRSDQIIRSAVDGDFSELSYGDDITGYKNYFYCDNGSRVIFGRVYPDDPTPTGLERYETMISVDSKVDKLEPIKRKARQAIKKANQSGHFIDCELVDATKGNIQLGNIITVAKADIDYEKVRVIEFMESWDEQGYTKVPTFEEVE